MADDWKDTLFTCCHVGNVHCPCIVSLFHGGAVVHVESACSMVELLQFSAAAAGASGQEH